MDIHSSWRDADIADLIPGLNGALADPSKIEPDVLREKLDAILGSQLTTLQTLVSSDDFQNFRSQEDPKALARVLETLEQSMLEVKRITTFALVAEMHYADQSQDLKEPFLATVPQLQGVAGFLNQSFSEVISYVASMDDDKLRDVMTESPELNKFATLIDRCRTAPQPNLEKAAQLNPNNFAESFGRLEQSKDKSLSEDERKQAFAEGLSGIIKFKQDQAIAGGFQDTLAQFSFSNDAPDNLISNFAAASEGRMGRLTQEFIKIQELAKDRLPASRESHKYTWDETKDIVCAAYTRLDPELGNLARRAFDEGWVLAKTDGIVNPQTVPSLPVSQSPNSHPFMATNFDEGVMDVVFVGHEMAHVLSNYIAGQKQGVFTHDAPSIVQETFSHFGEAMLEQEMLQRAENPAEKAWVHIAFLAREFDMLTVVPIAKFEEELYTLVKSKGESAPTFDEINNLFKQSIGDLQQVQQATENEIEIRDAPGFWNIVMSPPHTTAVYPITKIMSATLRDGFERNPEQFRERYHEIMEAGGNMGVAKLWSTLLGQDPAEPQVINARLDDLVARTTAIKDEIATMPPILEGKEAVNDKNILENAVRTLREAGISAACEPDGGIRIGSHRIGGKAGAIEKF